MNKIVITLFGKWLYVTIFMLYTMMPFICSATLSNGQDSLIQHALSLKEGREKADLMNELCLQLYYSNPDTALYFGHQALAIGKHLNNDTIIGKAYNRIGIIKDVTVQWDSALIYYDKAKIHAKRVNDTITLASVFNNIGLIYWNKGLLDQAVENFNHSLVLAEAVHLSRSLANAYNNIGLVYWDQKRIDEAIDYQFKALKIRQETNDKYGEGASYTNIGMLYDETQRYDSAIVYLRKAIRLKIELNDQYGLGKVYTNIGMTFDNINQSDSAVIYLRKAIEIHQSTYNYYNAASSMFNLATIYFKMKEYKQSVDELELAIEISEAYHFHKLIYKIYHYLGLNYQKLEDYKKASDYFWHADLAKDTLYDVERDRAVEEIQSKYETEKKNKEIALLEKMQVEQSLVLAKRKRFIYLLIGLVILTLLSAIIFIQNHRSKAATRRNQAIIEEKEKGLRAIVKATEDERKRIAKDLHDGVGQQVSGLKLFLQQMNLAKDENLSKAAKINEIVNELGEDIRSISHQMMPRSLQELGLVEALNDMLEKSIGRGRLNFQFDYLGIKHRFDEEVEVAIYRICQELINNIIKHSGADEVKIQLMQRKNLLMLIVEDDGTGISDLENMKNGIGMLTIQNRLKLIDGDFQIESEPGQGTIATVRVNLK